jgi:processive 1,2-diacylglycerol beta-glucosyltransferase
LENLIQAEVVNPIQTLFTGYSKKSVFHLCFICGLIKLMRILIATVTAGGGHNAAAAALEEAWRALRPDDAVERIDLLKFFSPLHKRIYADGYVKFVEHAPELWGMLFSKTDDLKVVRRFSKWSRAFPSPSRNKFKKHLQSFRPDAVLCTHFLPHELLGLLRKSSKGPHPFVATVVTDFEAHALWMDSCVDLYCVAADETRARLVARGIPPENIVVTGIPISAKFASKPDPKAVRKAYGLRDDLPVMLVLGGGFGMGPVAEILTELDKAAGHFQIVVVAGRNEKLRRDLGARDHKHPTHILGFSSNMHELMAISEVIITKPGGLTTSEALAMGKPLFILNPIPGQEAANSDFLLERGAAAKANRVEDLPFRVGQLTGSKKLAEMARAAKALGRPQAAQAICGEVLLRTSPQ